jgi:cell division septation protein DedD/nucleoid DNA-binding protein
VNFGKYIHQLLLENEIVIIPGFGAFVSEYKPAEINEGSDEIKPPSKIVLFNQQIRNNDGLLVGYVAEKQRSSHFEALKKIEKEREDILYRLDSGEHVELNEVGVLFYTEENTIGFTAVEDENLLLDSFGLEATTIDSSEESEEFVEPEPIESSDLEEEKTEEIESESESGLIEPIVEPIEDEEEKPEEIENEVEPAPAAEPEPTFIPETNFRMAEPVPADQKKKRGWWWFLLILIPLIVVSVFIFMKGKKGGELPKQEEIGIEIIEQPTVVVPQDTIKAEFIDKDSVEIASQDTIKIEESKPESKILHDPSSPKYYLVGGSFSVEENAETYLKELKDKGFDAFHVGKKGRFFIVGIGTYNTFSEAEKAKQEYMTNNPGSEVWVWKK